MSRLFLGDSSLSSEITSLFGGKALKLHQLSMAGFPVPKGLVLLSETPVLEEDIQKLGGFPVAVRSSGALEDLNQASFAGLYETFLFVNSMDELKKAVHQCFESRNSERVKDYLRQKKISWTSESLKMSVLIQRMVDAQQAGVLFTLNPLNGKEEEIYLELCEGVGERLVSGHVTPTRLSFNWKIDQVVQFDVNDEGSRLDAGVLESLVATSLKIQAFYGHPQDIEWAVDKKGELFILQSRPVTTYALRDDYPELTNADLKDGGISARVCTPLMNSAYRDPLQVSMGGYFKSIKLISDDEGITWMYSAYGRGYWNAGAVKAGLTKIPGFKEEDFDRDLGIQKFYGEKGPHRTPVSVATVVGAIPVILALHKEFKDCLNMIAQFRVRFELVDAELKEGLPLFKTWEQTQFRQWFLRVLMFQFETEKNYFRTIYNNSNYQGEFKTFLKKLKTYQEGDEIDLMGELHGVAHLDVQPGLAKLVKVSDFYGFSSQNYHEAREKFLQQHYHHGPAELDITVPRWGEKKEWVDELVRNFVPVTVTQGSRYSKTLERLQVGLGWLEGRKLVRTLKMSRDFLRLREEMRSFSTRGYYLLRLGLLEFSRRESFEDVFMLELGEVRKKLLDPSWDLPDVSKRLLAYEGYRYFNAPNEFGGKIEAHQDQNAEGKLKGLGCSPGEFTGRARVVLNIHETGSLTKEDILVTKFTDPGWTPTLARVGGVVTEVGGLLSHAAVIGREYGIPAILNLGRATQIIPDGALIRMNGKSGLVEILEEGSNGESDV